MVEEDKDEQEGGEAPKKGGSKKVMIIAIVAVVLVLGGVGAFLAMKGGKAPGEEGEAGAGEEEAAVEEGEAGELPGAVLPLETFIVNLRVKGSFLKATVQLEFIEPELPKTVESQVPKIRDAVIRILSTKDAAEILTADGKDKLRQEILEGVNSALGTEDVVKVYFTEFIIQ